MKGIVTISKLCPKKKASRIHGYPIYENRSIGGSTGEG